MKRVIVFAAFAVLVFFAGRAQAQVSVVMNGSFENDGVVSDVSAGLPERWEMVDVAEGQFAGWIDEDWSTHGRYSMTLYSRPTGMFEAGDVCRVSQQVYLQDVEEIIFDIRLDTDWSGIAWSNEKRSAQVLLDGQVLWDSVLLGPDADGEYSVVVDGIDVNDANEHTLSLAMRANVSEAKPYVAYIAQWDFVKFDTHCGGFGYLPQDLSRDCYVDMTDLKLLAARWLSTSADYPYDLAPDVEGCVNLADFTVFSDRWLANTDWKNYGSAGNYEMKLLEMDLNDDGVVDAGELAKVANDWLSEGAELGGDLDGDGTVDFRDFAAVAGQWQMHSWLYGLE